MSAPSPNANNDSSSITNGTTFLQHQLEYMYSAHRHDEIDLREILVFLWKGKWLILVTTTLFAVAAALYATNTQEWWTSKAVITAPQRSDFTYYQQHIKKFQPLFDVYKHDGDVIVDNQLDILSEPVSLLMVFVNEFNSSANKKFFWIVTVFS